VRVSRSSQEITGLAIRDFGGMKIHMPTLKRAGYELFSALPGSFITTDDEKEAWSILQHTLIQNHLHHLVKRLHLPRAKAWSTVRAEMIGFFAQTGYEQKGPEMRAYFMAQNVEMKAFLRMKMHDKYRDVSSVNLHFLLKLDFVTNSALRSTSMYRCPISYCHKDIATNITRRKTLMLNPTVKYSFNGRLGIDLG